MPTPILSERTSKDIDQQVNTILADLGWPEPPLDLDQIRQLLKLDRHYYSSTDHGLLQQVVHKLTIGSKQIISEPQRLWNAVRQGSLRALWVPDSRRIFIDQRLPDVKQRWGETHEIIHSIIPHHALLTLGDAEHTLTPACHELIEAEANYGAGRLLFMGDRFRHEVLSSEVSFDRLNGLRKSYGNTLTTTLWRAVESLDVPAFGLVSKHPRGALVPGQSPIRYFVRSAPFVRQFSQISEAMVFNRLASYCFAKRGPLGKCEQLLHDGTADHVFRFESFSNTYDVLTLGIYSGPRGIVVAS